MFRQLPIVALLWLTKAPTQAQVYHCGNTWQSSPCATGEQPAIPADTKSTRSTNYDPIAKSKKDSLLHETQKLTLSLGSDYSIEKARVDELAEYCSQETTSVEACERANLRMRERLRIAERQESKTNLLERRDSKLAARNERVETWKKQHPSHGR